MKESPKHKLSILYANRNRDVNRIKASLYSLEKQTERDFEVIFVDYGSDSFLVDDYCNLLKSLSFVRFFSLEVPQLLWNKSKALNYGINKAKSQYVFIADVDLIFHPDAVNLFNKLMSPKSFFLFKLGYLNSVESKKLEGNFVFTNLQPERFGPVNGMILVSREAVIKVHGLDEFFHFYGAEDEDLFARLENAGYKREIIDKPYFCHNWHKSFSGSEDKLMTGNPRVKNIMRINQRHFLRNKERGVIQPLHQKYFGEVIHKVESEVLKYPTKTFQIESKFSHVEHFIRVELTTYKDEIIKVIFIEDPHIYSWKHKIKKVVGKQTQRLCSMKEVNDMLLKEILYNYRNHNYSLSISKDLKKITFCIKL